MKSKKPLVDKTFVLQKYPGKGGWTYILIPEPPKKYKSRFGHVKIKGSIDGFSIKQYNLMPMTGGGMFFPVKSEIRKKIGKEAGDRVKVILFSDDSLVRIPAEIKQCLQLASPEIYATFKALTESEKKQYLDWIGEAKAHETRARRIIKMIERVSRGLALYEVANPDR